MADTKEVLKCPACENFMTKIFMPDAEVNVDVCTEGCGGILFDNREFNKFDEPTENADLILESLKDKTFIETDESETRTCPVCGVYMVKMGAGVAGVEIDYCNVCGAKFLDNGELQKIREGNRENQDPRLDNLLEVLCAKDFDKVTGGRAPEKSSPRRQFVENLVRKFL